MTSKKRKPAAPVGGHAGNDVGRGMTGGQANLRASVGDGRTSWGEDGAGADLGLEGTERRGLAAQQGRERSADYPRRAFPSEGSSSPADLGMGPGDPGYTSEEDDRGSGRLPRRV
jgi:hypothetical protein